MADIVALARTFCEQYAREFRSYDHKTQLPHDGDGWLDGFRTDESPDKDYLALRDALAGAVPSDGGAPPAERPTFRTELAALVNRYSLENGSNTPDYVLADYLVDCLRALDSAVSARSAWHGDETGPLTTNSGGFSPNYACPHPNDCREQGECRATSVALCRASGPCTARRSV